METVQDHYDDFLGAVYSWILGDFASAYRDNVELFNSMMLRAGSGDTAIDLGCGPGSQSIPLAELGFNVIAVDFCASLLDELNRHAGDLPIQTVCGDLLEFPAHLASPPNLIVCMGDTLVHLPDRESVDHVLKDVCSELAVGGTFIYAIRDYVASGPVGNDRFIPVRADDEQIFTCFLDYKQDVVHVHDILHRKENGAWKTIISDYLKLRLDTQDINKTLVENGLRILSIANRKGLIVVVANKPV